MRSGSGKLTADIQQLNQSGPVQGMSAQHRKKKKQGKTKQRTIQRHDSCPRASLACTSCRVCHSNPAASSLGENRGHSGEGREEVLPTCRLKGPVCKAATNFDRCQQIIGSRASRDHGAAVSSGSLPSLRSLPLKKKNSTEHVALRICEFFLKVRHQNGRPLSEQLARCKWPESPQVKRPRR